MSTTLNMHSLTRHFEERLRQIDRQNLGDVTGKEPHFPQLVVYLGKDASDAHTAVSTNLLQIWPQYQDELKFLCVQKTDGITYFEMPIGNEQNVALSENGVREIASALFGTRMHFADRSKLLVYFILDTTSMQSLDDFLSWLPVLHTVKALLCPNSTDLLNMLCLLLNENLTRQKTAAKIRNYLSCFYTNEELRKTVDNVLLLSNRRNDNAILEDWEIGYKIISATIALSNNEETRITTNIFCNSVLTASYAREEKPISQIGQVVVGNLLLSLAENAPHTDPKLMDDPKLAEKLGLTKNGTFTILDQYAQTNLYALLPSEEQLELFPRRDAIAQVQMSMLSANAFNEFTMGAWNQYLAEMIRTAREKLEMNSALRQKWGDAYRKFLADTFKKEEILYLADHIDDVVEIMSHTRLPSGDAQVLIAAREQLKYMLSSDESFIRIFVSALQQQGRIVSEFAQAWNSLLQSRRQVFGVRDANMSTFYERKIRNFMDRRGTEMLTAFAAIHNTQELIEFLQGTVEDIIDSDEVFSAAFEDELERRLNEDALPTDAKQYIRKKLTGSGVYTYLQTNFALGEPIVSSILIKIGTPLYKNLYSNLAPSTYYYNTGSSSAAEALVIYEVSRENLVNGEGA